jgi:hypothetical protein
MSDAEASKEPTKMIVRVCERCNRCFNAVTGEVPKAAAHMIVRPMDRGVRCNSCNGDLAAWPRG